MNSTRRVLLPLFLLGGASLCLAQPMPAFGPQSFEVTTPDADQAYTSSFVADESGPYLLFVHNGDDEGSRVRAATVLLNRNDCVMKYTAGGVPMRPTTVASLNATP